MAINCRLKSIYYQKIMNGGYGSGTLTAGYMKLGNLYQEIQHYDAAKHCYLERQYRCPMTTPQIRHNVSIY